MSNALEDLKQNGLPAWVYTWKTVAAIAFLGPIALMSVATAFSMIGDRLFWDVDAPDCFTIWRRPTDIGTKRLDRQDTLVASANDVHDKNVQLVLKAAEACRNESCPADARKKLRDSSRIYVDARARLAQLMLSKYGDEGLAFAQNVYGAYVDKEIVDILRSRFANGHLDFKGLHSLESPMRMLVLRPTTEFQPCRAN